MPWNNRGNRFDSEIVVIITVSKAHRTVMVEQFPAIISPNTHRLLEENKWNFLLHLFCLYSYSLEVARGEVALHRIRQ